MCATARTWGVLAFAVSVAALGAAVYAVWKATPDAARGAASPDESSVALSEIRDLRARVDLLESQAHAPSLATGASPLAPARKELADLRARIEALEKQAGATSGEADASSAQPGLTPEQAAELKERLAVESRRPAMLAQAKLLAYVRPPRRPIGSPPPDAAMIDLYLSWVDPEKYMSRGRQVSAKMLVDWMSDPEALKDVREKARDALVNSTARSMNPELQAGGKASLRAIFSLTNLVPQLRADDESARRLSAEVLLSYYYPPAQLKSIARYNPADPGTWDAAIDEWVNYLGNR